MINAINALVRDDHGQGLIEYSLIGVLVSIAAYVAMQTLGTQISTTFTNLTNDI